MTPAARPPDRPPLSAGEAEELRGYVREAVRAGFLPADEIAGRACEIMEDDPALRPHADRFAAEELAAHAVEAAGWPAVTDCDRLDAAFAALEETGIVARQDFSCCGNCGSAEIDDEMEAAAAAGARPVRGYCFYHMQDTARVVDGGGLSFNYGPRWEEGLTDADYAPRAVAVGKEVAAALAAAGLEVDWNGRLDRRIGVALEWCRRRPDL